jgi:hypothetical protein
VAVDDCVVVADELWVVETVVVCDVFSHPSNLPLLNAVTA